jgi:hypothetical protein
MGQAAAPVADAPSAAAPETDSLPATPVGPCLNYVQCPTVLCYGDCLYEFEETVVDLGVQCCLDHGQVFSCPSGTTVHRVSNACGGDECITASGYQTKNHCW